MDWSPVLSAFAVAVCGAILPTIQYITNRSIGVNPAQDRLVDLMEKRIEQLEAMLADEKRQRESLQAEVQELRTTVTQQAIQLARQQATRSRSNNA